MKHSKLGARVFAILFGVMLLLFGTFGVLADNDDSSSSGSSVPDEPAQTEYVPPETEAPQPETEAPQPEPETAAPQPETEAPKPEIETEAPQRETEAPQQETEGQINNIDNNSNTGTTEFFIPPTVPKTVSQKTYSTNKAFGASSWICVAVGIVVILAVAISTKAGGRKNRGV